MASAKNKLKIAALEKRFPKAIDWLFRLKGQKTHPRTPSMLLTQLCRALKKKNTKSTPKHSTARDILDNYELTGKLELELVTTSYAKKGNKTYTERSKAFFVSRSWRELRYKALIKHGKKCQCCGAKPPAIILHVDHVKPRSKFPELELDINNLQILCEQCNMGKGAWDQTDHR